MGTFVYVVSEKIQYVVVEVEKGVREAGLRSLGQASTAERTKCDGQLTAMKDEVAANIADLARDADAKHGEARALINREKNLREAHHAEVLALLEDAKMKHGADVQDMKAQLDAARTELKYNSEMERAILKARVKEGHSTLDDRCSEAAFSKHREEHETSVSQLAEALRQEHTCGLKRVESLVTSGHASAGEAAERFSDLDNHIRARIPGLLADLNDAKVKIQEHVNEQVEALRAMKDEVAANIADLARDADAKHGEARALINREKTLREAHHAEVLALLDDAKMNHGADVQDMKAQLDAARTELKYYSENERAILMARVKEGHSTLDDRCNTLMCEMDAKVKKRDEHLAKLKQMIIDEKQAWEAAFSKHREDHETSVSQLAEALRQEHTSGLAVRHDVNLEAADGGKSVFEYKPKESTAAAAHPAFSEQFWSRLS